MEGKIFAIFWRNRLGYKEGQQAKIAQFLGGISWDPSSQNYTIPRGSWQLAVGSLIAKTVQFPDGANSCLLGHWQQKLHNS